MKSVLYAGSFDPPTNGHIDVVRRMVELFDNREIVVGIGKNYDKGKFDFNVKERTEMFRKALSVYPELEKVKVTNFEGSLGGYAYENMATVLKGVRDAKDFEYEKNQFEAIEMQELGVDTVLLPARKEMSSIASSYVKGLQRAGLSIEKLVHPYVKQCVEARLSSRYIIGVTGEVGAGKSTACRKLQELGKENGIPVHYIDLDKIPHGIYDGVFKEPLYAEIRKQIVEKFGKDVELPDGKINRKALGEIVFNDRSQLQKLNEIVYKPMMSRLRRETSSKSGLIIIEAALAAELGMTYISNNNCVLVSADKKSQERRLRERGLGYDQIKRRVESQINTDSKREIIQREISKNKHGRIWEVDNSDNLEPPLAQTLDDIIKDVDQYGQLRFTGMWNRVGADGTPDREYERLLAAYLEPHRVYHSLPHVVSGLNEISDAKLFMTDSDQLTFAWFYHDYVFKDGSRVNEVESAKTAYNVCKEARLDENFAQNVKNLVSATKHHSNPSVNSIDEGFIKDIDLTIFGKPVEEFDAYDNGIREEYKTEGSETFKKGRLSILEGFLNRPHIYCTGFFRQKYETKAKENLQRAIERLSV